MATDKEKEELREAAELLLESQWVLRQETPEAYFLIRRYEKRLVEYFREKCGWPLLVNAQFYKLEKIPAGFINFLTIFSSAVTIITPLIGFFTIRKMNLEEKNLFIAIYIVTLNKNGDSY